MTAQPDTEARAAQPAALAAQPATVASSGGSSPAPSFGRELTALIRLAIPLVVARAGHNLMAVVDTMVAGRISPESVAAVGLGGAAWFMVYVVPMGVLLGLDPLVSQAVGAGRRERWMTGLAAARWVALVMAVPTIAATLLLPDLMLRLAQPVEVVEALRPYMAFMALGIVPGLLFHTTGTYLTAHGHTRQFVMITLCINGLNLVLDLWFVHGGLGVPALGVAGIGAATAGCAFAEWGLLSWAVRRDPALRALGVPWQPPKLSTVRDILRTGLPVGVQYGLEVAGFTTATLLVGTFGSLVLAGHQIALNFAGMTFTFALGVSSAASVRVGQALGRGDADGVRTAGRAALVAGLALGAGGAIVMAFGRFAIARAYTPDPETIAYGAAFLAIAAVFQLADMSQAIGFGVLRGLDDTRVPMLFNVVGYWCVGLPLGALGAFQVFGDPRAIWWGLTAALAVVAVALRLRFVALTRRI